jgi:2-phospho-L-lactate guanylyltransferase
VKLWAIVPVKPLHRGKTRLSGVLSEADRYALNISLLVRTLEVLKASKSIYQVALISRDPAALAIGEDCDVEVLREEGEPGLNPALQSAARQISAAHPDGLLILPADLPLIQPADINAMAESATVPPVVVIAPDRHGSGTNALVLRPADQIEFTFGIGSFARHCQAARSAGASLRIADQPAVGLDLDMPEDLELLREMEFHLPGFNLPAILSIPWRNL